VCVPAPSGAGATAVAADPDSPNSVPRSGESQIGDAAEISAKRVRKQKTDRQDAQLILRLLLKDAQLKLQLGD
jgi:hypothetical protein